MGQSSTKIGQIEWRRNKVQELSVKGFNQADIARTLNIPKSTISRDIEYLRREAKENIKKYVDEKIPEEYEKCLIGLNSILKESWNMSDNAVDKREKIEALKLARDCYSMRLDLLTNSNVINDSMRFIEKSKENLTNNKKKIDHSDIQGPAKDYSNQSTEQQTVF